MGGMGVLGEIGSLMWSHPYVSCSLLVFFTPPFFPIIKFFSPLLISTALFVVALVTLGPHFEPPTDHEEDFLVNAADFRSEEPAQGGDARKPSKEAKPSWSDWAKSWKEAGISWVERKLRNENWKGGSLNDDNVSILQEAFAHRAAEEEGPRLTPTKLATRRLHDGEESIVEERTQATDVIPALADAWTSTRDLPHDFFSPHPSFARRHAPLFENVVPPPIDYDMPPIITGPASITAPLFKSLEEDMSDDEYVHDSDHEHLEMGESTVGEEEAPVANGVHHQPVEGAGPPSEIVPQESSAAEPDPLLTPKEAHQESGPPEGHAVVAEERSVPAAEGEGSRPTEEVPDIPELEDVLQVEDEDTAPAAPAAAPVPDEAPATSETPSSEVLSPPIEVLSAPSQVLSAPSEVLSPPAAVSTQPSPDEESRAPSPAEAGSLQPVPEDLPTSIPEQPPLPGPSSPDLATVATLDDGKESSASASAVSEELSTTSSTASVPAGEGASQAAPEEQVTNVTEAMKSVVEETPPKKFQPDAPELRITPPSTKVVLTPPRASAGLPSQPPPASSSRSWSSSDEEFGDEQTDLDSDVEVVGDDSDSDLDLPPPKPTPDQLRPAHTMVQA